MVQDRSSQVQNLANGCIVTQVFVRILKCSEHKLIIDFVNTK